MRNVFRLSCEFLKGKRIYMIYLKFIFHFSFSSLPSQVRSRSVSNPFQVRSLEGEQNGRYMDVKCWVMAGDLRTLLVYCVFYHKYHYTTDDGHGEESETEPCCDDAECKGNCSCDGRWRCLCYCWESHYGKGNVWHIVKETAKKRVPYSPRQGLRPQTSGRWRCP